MLIGSNDRYGDMDIEDVDEFQELEMEDHPRAIDPMAHFEPGEVNNFDRDFDQELGESWDDEWGDDDEYEDSEEDGYYDDDGL